MKYDYLIVGAGLFGATFAQKATEAGKRVLVIDKRLHVGGNIYTEDIEGIQVHKYGAHIFHTNNKDVWDYVNQFAVFNRYTNSPVANYNGEIYNLPFNMAYSVYLLCIYKRFFMAYYCVYRRTYGVCFNLFTHNIKKHKNLSF